MQKQCKQCHKTYQLYPEDQAFYKRIQIPAPELCPQCRYQARLAYKNDFNLHERQCDLCKRQIISMYDEYSGHKIYCRDCWWSDKWNASDIYQAYDFNKDFFTQFKQLQLEVPRVALINNQSENSDFCNFSDRNKDCYLLTTGNDNENCYYSFWMLNNKDSMDLAYCRGCQQGYELVQCENCYELFFSQLCEDCSHSRYLYDCKDCHDCLGCVGLRHQEYRIFNKQYAKSEYEQKIKKLKKQTIILEFEKLKLKQPRKFYIGRNSQNISGDFLVNCANVRNSYDVHDCQNCSYCGDGVRGKDSSDVISFDAIELCYNCVSTMGYNYICSYYCRDSKNIYYCDSCHNCHECFGCVGLRNKRYCVLNKQYGKSDYFSLKKKIIEHLGDDYGNNFPVKNSPFAYNQTLAQVYLPLKKEEIIGRGWRWHETEVKNIDNSLPVCVSCCRNFKMIPQELKFYERFNLEKPDKCFNCRHQARINLRNPRSLWRRQCDCTQPTHGHHGRCLQEFETTYSPERKELVYCEECYNKEIY